MQRALNHGDASAIYMGDLLLDNLNGENPFGPKGGWETGYAGIEFRAISPPWAKSQESYELNGRMPRGHVELVSEGKRLYLGRKTAPGMSGTLLLAVPSEGKAMATGMLAQYSPYLDSSYFTTMDQARELLEKYEDGKRGSLTDTTWKMRNGLTFRDYGDGSAEANFVSRPSGNGMYADPGNGTYADPGNGTYADPGNGTYADPGESERLAADLKQCVDQGFDFRPFLSVKDIENYLRENLLTTPERTYQQLGIHPGMKWHGESVIGFEAAPKDGKGAPFLLFANQEAVNFMVGHRDEYDFTPVKEGTDLLPFLKRKLQTAFPKLAELDTGEARFKSTNFYDERPLKLIVKKDSAELVPYGVVLDAKGRVMGDNLFLPIVTGKDKKERERTVDLRGLFFTDLTDVSQDYTKDANGHSAELSPNPETFEEALRLHNSTPKIEVRAGEQESAINLVPESCNVDSLRVGNPNFQMAGKYTRFLCH